MTSYIITGIIICLSPFFIWHFWYLGLDFKLVKLLTIKYPQTWKILLENKYGYTFYNYYGFNKSHFPIGKGVDLSFYPVGPYAQLRAIKFLEDQKIVDSDLNRVANSMKKIITRAILLVKIYLTMILLGIVISLGYIYTH